MELTDRQAQVLGFIKAFISDKGYPPTRAEISKGFGFASDNAAEEHVKALAKKGALRLTKGVSRGIAVIGV